MLSSAVTTNSNADAFVAAEIQQSRKGRGRRQANSALSLVDLSLIHI